MGFDRARALQQLDNKRACHHQCGPTCGRQLQGTRQARSAVHSAVIYEIARQPAARTWKRSKVVDKSSDEVVDLQVLASKGNPATRNRTRDHLIAAGLYSQMLYQLSHSRLGCCEHALLRQPGLKTSRLGLGQDTMRSEYAPCLCERPHLSSGQR